MTTLRSFAATGVLASTLLLSACMHNKKGFENWSTSIPPGHFRTVATIAQGSSRAEIRIMVTVRQDLQKAGINAVPSSGRWETVPEALGQVCGPGAPQPVDGMLVVSYDHLVLYDCQTSRAAFEVQGTAQKGITDMTDRLVKYLSQKPPASP